MTVTYAGVTERLEALAAMSTGRPVPDQLATRARAAIDTPTTRVLTDTVAGFPHRQSVLSPFSPGRAAR